AAAAAFCVVQPAKANQITNPGFETGNLSGWTLSPGFFAVGTASGVSPHSGSFQAFTATGSGALGQSFATTLGQSYTVDFWAATTSGGALSVLGGSTVFNHIFAGPTGYTEFTFTFTATSASSAIHFSAAGFFFLDDINVSPTGVPDGGTTAALLGCALLGLVCLRRKMGC
ncbi:MAG TPA: VPDSG-CTERM sorting domain-containing protein, partial [Candidatus Udaeobacter sp.]